MVRQPAGKIIISLPFPVARSLSRENQGKTWCLFQADVYVACAAAYFWEGGASFFVRGLVWVAMMVAGAGRVSGERVVRS